MYPLNNTQLTFAGYSAIEPLLIDTVTTIRSIPKRINNMLESAVIKSNPQQYQYFRSCRALFEAESTFHIASSQLLILPSVPGIDIDLYFVLDHAKTQYVLTYMKLKQTGDNISKQGIDFWKLTNTLIDSKLGIPETININNFTQYGLPLTYELENGIDKEYPTMLAVSGTLTLNYLDYLKYKRNKGSLGYDEILTLWLSDSNTAIKTKGLIKPTFLASDVRANTGILSKRVKKFTSKNIMMKRKYLPCTLMQKLRTLEHCKFNAIINTSYDNVSNPFVMAASAYSMLGNLVPYLTKVKKTMDSINGIKKVSHLKEFLVDIESRDSIRYNYLKEFPYLLQGVNIVSNYLWVSDLINDTGSSTNVYIGLDSLSIDDLTLKAFLLCYTFNIKLDLYNRLVAHLGYDFYVDPTVRNPITKKFIRACNETGLVSLSADKLSYYNSTYNTLKTTFQNFNTLNQKGKSV